MATRVSRLRKTEEDRFSSSLERQLSKPRAELRAAQLAEMQLLQQKCHGQRMNAQRQKAQEAKVLAQRYRNLGADLAHAHAIETTLPAEIGMVTVQPSRSTHGSTFRGTCALAHPRSYLGAIPPPPLRAIPT